MSSVIRGNDNFDSAVSGLKLMTAQNSTSGTSIDFVGIPFWAKRITVMFNGVSTNGTSNLLVQLGSGSIQTTGYASSSSIVSSTVITTSSVAGFILVTNNASDIKSGVVDFESGLYVAPDKSASFDQKNKVYVSENIGAVDKETGQYVAPKGLKLDSVKGFVVTDTVQDPTLIALKEDLNKDITILKASCRLSDACALARQQISWKHWKKPNDYIDFDKLYQAYAVIFHEFINLCLLTIPVEEIKEIYIKKNVENILRQEYGY